MTEQTYVTSSTPFLYGRIWLHWLDTPEIRGLSGRAFRMWVLLHAHAAGQAQTDPFTEALAQESGISDLRNIRECFQELERAGLLKRDHSKGYGAPGRKATVYHLFSPPSVQEQEAQAAKDIRKPRVSTEQVVRGSKEPPEQTISGSQGSAERTVTGSKGSAVTGSKGSAVTGSKGSASQDSSQDSSQDLKHTAAPGVSPSDFSEIERENQEVFRELATVVSQGLPAPAGQPGAPRAQVKNGPTSPEWPHGEPSHPSSVSSAGWSRIGAILPTDLSAEKPPGEDQPAGDIEDRRAQVESDGSKTDSHRAQVNGDSQAVYTLPPRLQAQAEARDLVCEWWQQYRQVYNYQPTKQEISYASGLLKRNGKSQSYELVVQGTKRLKESGMFPKTLNFCGLKAALGEV